MVKAWYNVVEETGGDFALAIYVSRSERSIFKGQRKGERIDERVNAGFSNWMLPYIQSFQLLLPFLV
jgi:hypothetical protein